MDELPIAVSIAAPDLDYALLMIGVAWLAILGVLAWGGALELWRSMRGPERAPFFGMLGRRGISLVQAEQVAGFDGLRAAAGRCASCGAREGCRRALRWGWLGFEAPPCPNDGFFARVCGNPEKSPAT